MPIKFITSYDFEFKWQQKNFKVRKIEYQKCFLQQF